MLTIPKQVMERRVELSHAKYELTVFLEKLETEKNFTYGEMFELLSDQLRDYAKSLIRAEQDEKDAIHDSRTYG